MPIDIPEASELDPLGIETQVDSDPLGIERREEKPAEKPIPDISPEPLRMVAPPKAIQARAMLTPEKALESRQESLIGLTPEIVPTGAAITEATGIPKVVTVPASAAGRLAAGVGAWATTPQGLGEMAVAATPAAPAVFAKWAYDMLKGGYMSVKDAGETVAGMMRDALNRGMVTHNQLGVTPEANEKETQAQIQRLAEDAVNSVAMLAGGAGVGVKAATGTARAAARLIPTPKTEVPVITPEAPKLAIEPAAEAPTVLESKPTTTPADIAKQLGINYLQDIAGKNVFSYDHPQGFRDQIAVPAGSSAEVVKTALDNAIKRHEKPTEPTPIPAPTGVTTITPMLQIGEREFIGTDHAAARTKGMMELDDPLEATKAYDVDANHKFIVVRDGKREVLSREEAAPVFDELAGNPPGTTKKLESQMLKDAGLLKHLEEPTPPEPAPAAPTPPTPPTPTAKEPWEMTRKAWDKYIFETEGGFQTTPRDIREVEIRNAAHRQYVEQALREGKPVPPEVLADYPDLARPTPAPAAEKKGKTVAELQALINKQRGIVKRSDWTKKKGKEAKAKLEALENELRETQSRPSTGEPVYWSRESSETDIRNVTPKGGADTGERVRLANGQVWEYKGISGYKADNLNRVNGWENVTRRPEQPTPPPGTQGLAKPPEPPITGMGGAVPAEFKPTEQTATGIKNATVDQERIARGLPAAIQPLRRSFGEVWDRAMAMIDHDPGVTDALLNDLREKPRALTDVEDALILQRQVDLQNEYGKATRDLAQAFDDGRMDDVTREKLRVAGLSDQLLDLYNIGKKVGTETGRGLNARKMMANEDFSLAQMELAKRSANNGRPLTDAERAELKSLHDRIAATQKAYDDYRAATDVKLAQLEAARAIADIKAKAAPTIDKRVLAYAEKIVSGWETEASSAAARLKEKLKPRLGITPEPLDPTIISDAAIWGRAKISRLALDAAKFTDHIVTEFGEGIRPYIDAVWKASNDLINKGLEKVPERVSRSVKKTDLAGAKASTVQIVADKVSKGKRDEVTWYVQKLARAFVENGITDRERLIDEVHSVLQEAIPDITRRQTMDAISGYGDYKQLSKDQITVQLRGMKGEMQQLAKLEDMAAGKPPLKSGVERRTPTEAERQLIKRVNDAKVKFQVPVQDPNTQLKSALDTLKTTLKNRIADYEDRLARKDFAPRPRREIQLDETAARLKAENERVKKRFQEALIADRLKNRTIWEKAMDWGTKYRRSGVLSSPIVIPKLISAAIQRLSSVPVEEAIGAGLSKIPGVGKVSAKAPLEGGGWNTKAEMRGFGAAFTKGMSDAYRVLKTGHSDLDLLYGKAGESYTGEYELASKLLAIPGRLHGMIKAPVKRAIFERAVQRMGEFYARQGLDVTDEVVKYRIAVDAYKAGNRSIFLNDNFIASKVTAFISEKTSKETGHATPGSKVFSTAGRIALPIVRVPTNIVAETMQYVGGLVSGNVRLALALRKGVENLTPDQADLIMRELKKGSIGAAVLALGYFNSDAIGGYYQPGKKKKEGEIKWGSIRVNGVDVPSYLLHNPLLETLQVGATIRNVASSKLRKKDTEPQGIAAGIGAAAFGMVEQVPFVREMAELEKARNPYQRGAFMGEQAKSILVPALVQKLAAWTDTTQRAPTNLLQHVQTGIPGLRQSVPPKIVKGAPPVSQPIDYTKPLFPE